MTTTLLIGKNGQVGWELQNALVPLGPVISPGRSCIDLTKPDTIRKTIRDLSPTIIVNAAGYTAVDKAEAEPALVKQINATAPGILAEEAKHLGALLVHYSTDYVFDGKSPKPYTEEDRPSPVNIYGKSKLEGEQAIIASGCPHLILRTSWIYSARGINFVLTILRLARESPKALSVVDDQIGSPTWARLLANATATLLSKVRHPIEQTGIYHLSAAGYTSRFNFAKTIVNTARQFTGTTQEWAEIRRTTTKHYPLPATRPLNAATSKDKIRRVFSMEMPTWEEQLELFLQTGIVIQNES